MASPRVHPCRIWRITCRKIVESLPGCISNECIIIMHLFRVVMMQLGGWEQNRQFSVCAHETLPWSALSSQVCRAWRCDEWLWGEHYMSNCSQNVQMVHEGVASSVWLCGFEKVFSLEGFEALKLSLSLSVPLPSLPLPLSLYPRQNLDAPACQLGPALLAAIYINL